jgi:methionyl-tRNA synthetase
LLDQLGIPSDKRDFTALGEAGRLLPGAALPPPQGLFPRIVETEGNVI